MPGPQKRRTIAREDADVSETDESDEDSYTGQEEIQTDFEGRNPEVVDFHGIKQLLQQLFLKAHIDLSQLTDIIIAQAGLGSVLKQSILDEDEEDEDDDDVSDPLDVFGVTTIVNLSVHKETPCIQQITQLIKELSEQYSNLETQKEVDRILKSRSVGLLINERFVNIPAKISDPLLSTLLHEIEKYQSKDPRYEFEYFVLICKVHKPKNDIEETIFVNCEEEIFAKEARATFEFSVAAETDTSVSGKWADGDIEMIPYRKILFVDARQINTVIDQIKVLLS